MLVNNSGSKFTESIFSHSKVEMIIAGVILLTLFGIIVIITSFKGYMSSKKKIMLLCLILVALVLIIAGFIYLGKQTDYHHDPGVSAGYYTNIKFSINLLGWIGAGICGIAAILYCVMMLTKKPDHTVDVQKVQSDSENGR